MSSEAVNPHGDQKYWLNGTPFEGAPNVPADAGLNKFWLNGSPDGYLFPYFTEKQSFFITT